MPKQNVKPTTFRDRFGRTIVLTSERIWHIMRRPEMEKMQAKIAEALTDPDEVRRSASDPRAHLYYKVNKTTDKNEKYILVAVKILNGKGYIKTSLLVGRIKEGELVWKKS